MAKLHGKIILVPELSYRDMCRAQVTMEILQDYRNTHDDYDFERFVLCVIQKKAEADADA